MPFGTTRASDYPPDFRARLHPAQVASINTFRAQWGAPPVTTTGVWDPTGAVHEAERGTRLQFGGTVVRGAALAAKLFGLITGNAVIKAIGAALDEAAKAIAKEAGEILAELPEDIQAAFAAEFAHALAGMHWIRQRPSVLIEWEDAHTPLEAAAIRRYNDLWAFQEAGGVLSPAQLRQMNDEAPLRARQSVVAPNMKIAIYLPINRAPVIRSLLPGAADRARMDLLAFWMRTTTSTRLIAMMMRPPLTEEQTAILRRQTGPWRARNALHPSAVNVLLERPEWRRRVQAAKDALSLQKAQAAIDLANTPVGGLALERIRETIPSPTEVIAANTPYAPPPRMPAPPVLPRSPTL